MLNTKNLEKLFHFDTALHFEIFFALHALTDADSRIHQIWKQATLSRLPGAFHTKLERIGGWPTLWLMIPDLFPAGSLFREFHGIEKSLVELPSGVLQERLLRGAVHIERAVQDVLHNRSSIAKVVSSIAKKKREWLAYIDLYPYQKNSPAARILEFVLASPEEFRSLVLDVLRLFWERSFRQTWDRVQPELCRSVAEKERLFHTLSLPEFARQALLRIEFDEKRGRIRALRGGYEISYSKVQACYVLPSLFNERRNWTSLDTEKGSVLYLPYFDPSLAADPFLTGPGEILDLDPALIFRALGDTTRYAMVSLLARAPRSAADLARELSLSRPTVSHHIHLLREAGLLQDQAVEGSLKLSLRRDVLERLSEIATRKLFESKNKLQLIKTRSKA